VAAAGLIEPLAAVVPEGHRFGQGAVPQGGEVHLFAESQANKGHP
jgi:hypothetical protein